MELGFMMVQLEWSLYALFGEGQVGKEKAFYVCPMSFYALLAYFIPSYSSINLFLSFFNQALNLIHEISIPLFKFILISLSFWSIYSSHHHN